MKSSTFLAFAFILTSALLVELGYGSSPTIRTGRPQCFLRGPKRGRRCHNGGKTCGPCKPRRGRGSQSKTEGFLGCLSEAKKGRGRSAAQGTFKKWSNNVIPYKFDSSFTQSDREIFVKATQQIMEAVGCIKFRPKQSSDSEYILASRDGSCGESNAQFPHSYVVIWTGARAAMPFVTVETCLSPTSQNSIGHFVHELMHTLGFHHTQKRPDRDDYITVLTGSSQYSKCHTCNTLGVEYDCQSVMHYRDYSGNAMVAKDPSTCDLKANNRVLRKSDIELMNKFYGCRAESSCKGSCGGQSPGGCACDNDCEDRGDCCQDKKEVCPALTCRGNCNAMVTDEDSYCYCDANCEYYNDCCSDKKDYC